MHEPRGGFGSIDDLRALLEGLFDNSPVAFQVYRADGHCLLVNPAFRVLFGSEPPPEYNVFEDDILAKNGFLDLVRRAFAGETVTVPPHWYDPRELRQVAVPEGRRVGIEVTLFPLRDRTRAIGHVALCVRDVTAELELRETAEALRQSEEQLRQSQKLDAVGRLAGGIAHDFNNLLSIILSYSELLLRRLPTNDSMRIEIDQISKAGQRAADLTRHLLAFSRQQVLDSKVLDLNDIVIGLCNMLTRVLGEDVELKTVAAPRLGRVKADPGQIEQVIVNLALNSRDAMPAGGKLTIETADVELDDTYSRDHLGVKAGPHVMIAVSDTGVGMDKATQARIFEPFFTTKEPGKGTGLGLSTVFGIIKQSGGHVCFDSEPGGGTKFKIYLPRAEGSPEKIITVPPPATEPRGSETILLVEDEEQVRAVTVKILKGAGYTVLDTDRAEEAIALCERHSAEIHMLLTDVVMPKMNGLELARRVTLLRPTVKVLFMSGYTDDAIHSLGVLDSGLAFLQKPLTPSGLTRKVRDVLDAG